MDAGFDYATWSEAQQLGSNFEHTQISVCSSTLSQLNRLAFELARDFSGGFVVIDERSFSPCDLLLFVLMRNKAWSE